MFEKIKEKVLKALLIVVFVALVPLMTMGQAGCPQGCAEAELVRADCRLVGCPDCYVCELSGKCLPCKTFDMDCEEGECVEKIYAKPKSK